MKCVNVMCKYCDEEYDGSCGANQVSGNINDVECACFIPEKKSMTHDAVSEVRSDLAAMIKYIRDEDGGSFNGEYVCEILNDCINKLSKHLR